VGAVHVTCADESEQECCEAFQRGFVHYMLPALKFAHQSAFRLANLGGRYEWGAVRLAEQNFTTPQARAGQKLIVVKLNAHVAFEEITPASSGDHPFRFGRWQRYGTDSACCGALHSLIENRHEPFTEELRADLTSEGHDRITTLRDETRVEPVYRPLYAAIVSARIQARKAVMDVQEYRPATPTMFVIVPCVTVNRHERDTEILCGIYAVNAGEEGAKGTYDGLGDDPAAFEVGMQNRLFVVADEHVGTTRAVRDHREMVLGEWERQAVQHVPVQHEQLERIRRDVAENKHRHHHHARALLRVALPILAEVAPVPAAILMFSEGMVGIHHAFRIEKLVRQMSGTHEARQILNEIHGRIDALTPDEAEALVELLAREYRGLS